MEGDLQASLHSDYASHLLKAQDDAAAIIEQAKVTASRIVEVSRKTSRNQQGKVRDYCRQENSVVARLDVANKLLWGSD